MAKRKPGSIVTVSDMTAALQKVSDEVKSGTLNEKQLRRLLKDGEESAADKIRKALEKSDKGTER